MSTLVKTLTPIVKERMTSLQGTAHSYEHVERVFKIATLIAKREKADLELVQLGALLHDIGRVVAEPHNETGAKLAKEILKDINYPEERREKIARIVLLHPLDFRDRLQTLEEKVVWDADKIDLLGAAGIARGFHWCGKQPFQSAVDLAFQVFPPIYGRLTTSTARKIAAKRSNITMTFLCALKEELLLRDLSIK